MKNPFEYGGVVGPQAFCNRKNELAELKRTFENKNRLFIYSERRVGKTSLIKLALQSLPPAQYITAYVDLWPTTNANDFALRLAKAVTDASATSAKKLLLLGKTFFSSLSPAITLDQEGNPQMVFGVNKDNITIPALQDVLNSLPQIATKLGKNLVVVLDEFQQIVEYPDDSAEKTLRSVIQHHDTISYVFLGSKKNIIQNLFLDKQRPLYRSATHFPLPMIETKEWIPFITEKFEGTGKHIQTPIIEELCTVAQGHPFYTQHLCHALWEETEPGQTVADNALSMALAQLLRRESYAFTTLWESLTTNQKILLSTIAANETAKPFGANFIKSSGLGSASNVQRATESLLYKDLIDRDDNGQFFITDRFLKIWIQKLTTPPYFPL